MVRFYYPRNVFIITAIRRQASASATTSLPLPQGTSTATSTSPSSLPTPELEQTLALLSSHRSVLGYLLLSRGQPVSIIRHSGVVFEGEHGRKYASAIGRIVDGVQSALEEVSGEVNEGVSILSQLFSCPLRRLRRHFQDEIRFMRIRTKRHEIMISPGEPLMPWASHFRHLNRFSIDKRYLLAVLHDPTT